MKRIVTTYDMMISSPSDTAKEIEAVFESVMAFNRIAASREDAVAMVNIVKWNTDVFMNSNMTPQESINKQIVANCDFAVVIFRHRLGTPVGEDKSGTAQEIRLLKESNRQIFIYCLAEDENDDFLKGKRVEEIKEIGDQHLALKAYIEELKKEGIPIHTYKDAADLRNQFFNQLSQYDLMKNAPSLQKANDLGIHTIAIGSDEKELVKKKIEHAKHVKIFHTTGHTFFHLHIRQLAKMLRNNGTLQVLLPNPYSDFLEEVGRIEGRKEANPISLEFGSTIDNIRQIWDLAHESPCDTIGKIEIGCAHTMLRQTEIICIDKENEDDDDNMPIWCWVTMTMPPFRAGADSLSLECQTTKKGDLSLADMTNTNFNRCWEVSKFKIEFDGKQDIPYFYKEEHQE